jgi:hypothetical protein
LAVGLLSLAALLAPASVRAATADKLLPNDTESVVQVNVKQIIDSPLFKKFALEVAKEALKSQGEAKDVLDTLGLDPFKDIDSITLAGPGSSEPDKGLVIVRGRFDIAKFQKKAEEEAKNKEVLKVHKVPDGLGGNYTLYEVTAPDQPAALFVALASKNVILAAPAKDYLVDALDKDAGRKKTALKNQKVADMLGRVDDKQSVWAVLLGEALLKSPLGMDDTAKEILERIQDVAFGVTVDKDIKSEVVLAAKSDADAKELSTTIKGGLNQALGIVMIVGGGKPEIEPLIDILKTIKPQVDGKTVSVKAMVSGEVIEKAVPKDQ